jgi:hypothetical protein
MFALILVYLGRVGGEFDLDTLGLHGEHMAFWDCMGFKRLKNETIGLMALGSVCWRRYIGDEKNEYIPTRKLFLEAAVDIM